MRFPFFRNNANSISQEFKIKYKHSEIKQFNKCYVRYPILGAHHVLGQRYNNSVALLSVNNSGSKTVEATGVGETAADAEKDALKEALLSACGSAVSSKTIIKNDDVESEKIISKSRGIVQQYNVVKSEQKRGVFFCTVNAQINTNKLFVINRNEKKISY